MLMPVERIRFVPNLKNNGFVFPTQVKRKGNIKVPQTRKGKNKHEKVMERHLTLIIQSFVVNNFKFPEIVS